MLFILTGDVQIGKTRWLEGVCADLEHRGVCVAGVVAPGQWIARADDQPSGKHGFDGAGRFEKLGIDNVLYPEHLRITFARRRDLASACDEFGGGSQARSAGLGWAISDEAIAKVDAHFAELSAHPPCEGGLLVVDELGRLELMRASGLVSAMRALDAGPTQAFPHALVVARESLLDLACARFASAWDDIRTIGPTDDARDLLLSFFG